MIVRCFSLALYYVLCDKKNYNWYDIILYYLYNNGTYIL